MRGSSVRYCISANSLAKLLKRPVSPTNVRPVPVILARNPRVCKRDLSNHELESVPARHGEILPERICPLRDRDRCFRVETISLDWNRLRILMRHAGEEFAELIGFRTHSRSELQWRGLPQTRKIKSGRLWSGHRRNRKCRRRPSHH